MPEGAGLPGRGLFLLIVIDPAPGLQEKRIGGQTFSKRNWSMPKLTEREKLADLEARQRKLAQELDDARNSLRLRYAAIIPELGVERLTEREFRDLLALAIRAGGPAALAALKPLPAAPA